GGLIGSGGLTQVLNTVQGVSTLGEVSIILATQDGILNVTARQGIDIGAVVDPSYRPATVFQNHPDDQSYSATSAVNIFSTTGDIAFNTLPDARNSAFETLVSGSDILPATVSLTAFGGGISIQGGGYLYPSATGELSLIADQSIQLYQAD